MSGVIFLQSIEHGVKNCMESMSYSQYHHLLSQLTGGHVGPRVPKGRVPKGSRACTYPARASMVINAAKPTMAARPFQFSALGLQKALAKGSFLVNPLQAKQLFSASQGSQVCTT